MLVLQQIKVLPAGATFEIFDMYKMVVRGQISRFDKSVIFENVHDANMYNRIYQNFHVTLLNIRYIDAYDAIFEISVR